MKAQQLNVRSSGDGPWCWQNKAVRRLIRDSLDNANTVASGLGVYAALTEIASDQQSEAFQTTHAWIAKQSGLSVAGVKRRLRDLEEIKVISISRAKIKAPSTYTLLAIVHGEPSIATNELSIAHSQFRAPRATSEESPEEPSEKSTKKAASALPPVILPFPSEGFSKAWAEWVQFRKEKREKLTPTTIEMQFKKFSEWGEQRSIRAIEHTILKGWTGLREPSESNGTRFSRFESSRPEEPVGAGAIFVNELAQTKAAIPTWVAEVEKMRDELSYIEKYPSLLPDFIRRLNALPPEAIAGFTPSQQADLKRIQAGTS